MAQAVRRLATGWIIRGSNIGEGDFLHPFRPALEPTSPLYNCHRLSFPAVKLPEGGVDHPPPSNAEI